MYVTRWLTSTRSTYGSQLATPHTIAQVASRLPVRQARPSEARSASRRGAISSGFIAPRNSTAGIRATMVSPSRTIESTLR